MRGRSRSAAGFIQGSGAKEEFGVVFFVWKF